MGVSSGFESSTSAWASVFNLGNCAIGAGILSFPYAVQRSGLIGGVFICLIVAAVELFTLRVLMRQSTKHRSVTYQGLVMTALGSRAAEVMAWTIFLFLFGGCVAFMIIVGDTFGSVLRQYVINPLKLPPILAARQVMILIPAFAIMLPLSLQRSLGSLATASTVAVGVMMFTTVVIIGKCVYSMYTGIDGDGRPFLAGVSMFKFDIATFAAMPVMIFAYHCHVQAVPIYFELVDNPKLFERAQRCPAPGTMGQSGENANSVASTSSAVVATELPDSIVNVIARKLHGMYAVLAAAYAECTVMYLATGVAGYLLFPHTADSNILNNFSPEDTLMQIMRFLVGCAVVLHYPINQHIARSALYDLICRYLRMELREENVPYSHVAAMTVLFFTATTTTACVVDDLGTVFQLIGGLAGSLLIFVLPGALLIADAQKAAPPTQSAPVNGMPANENVPILGDGRQSSDGKPSGVTSLRGGIEKGGDCSEHEDARTALGLGDRPCYESRWDTPAIGCALVITGLCVIVLTLYTSIAPLLPGYKASDAGLHGSFMIHASHSEGQRVRRSLQALTAVLTP